VSASRLSAWPWPVRSHVILLFDLVWVVLAPAAALILRDNFEISTDRLAAIVPYSAISIMVAAILFPIAGINRTVWRFTSLSEALRLAGAVTLSIGLALSAAFAFTRLDGVARSLPIIQWFLLVAAMTAMRVVTRLMCGQQTPATDGARSADRLDPDIEHVLVVGLNPVTEFYLRSLAEFAATQMLVAGILADGSELRGRSVRAHKVLGFPEELLEVLAHLKVHGITIGRIVMAQPFEKLSSRAREMLLLVERTQDVTLDFFIERLGLAAPPASRASRPPGGEKLQTTAPHASFASAVAIKRPGLDPYAHVKRFVDLGGALALTVVLAPIGAMVALLVALDVGFPLLFWQLRPGRYSRPFKLYKFRTMTPAHDAEGNRIPDEQRSTMIGRCLRRLRLDEIPQIYNILRGEMSLVGPRPLLPVDQPGHAHVRLVARPGLTGWAQINGGRELSADDKTALDVWYVRNASFWLDLRILLRTVVVIVMGERRNERAIRLAVEELGGVRAAAASRIDGAGTAIEGGWHLGGPNAARPEPPLENVLRK
jgi:lipopolysaccharide/colanic/teichoic acid biosynthesis glycosyltransferase